MSGAGRPTTCTPRRTNDDRLPDPRRDPVPLHRGDGARHRARVAGPLGGGGHLRGAQPGRPAGPSPRRSPVAARSSSSSTCSRTRAASGCTSATRWATSAPTCTRRFHRMLGKNVLHCLGYDAFGLPAEQYAVQTGQHPRKTTEDNMVVMRRQLRRLGLGFDDAAQLRDHRRGLLQLDAVDLPADLQLLVRPGRGAAGRSQARRGRSRRWSRRMRRVGGRCRASRRPGLGRPERGGAGGRCSPKERLAYTSEAPVNWSPGLGTVLSNEEVTNEGRSERGNFPVFRRSLRQWMMRITAYADRLADDLDRVDWPEKVKIMQRNWIGRSEGARVAFPVARRGRASRSSRPVRTPCSAPRSWWWRPSTRWSTSSCRGAWPDGTPPAWTGGAADAARRGRGIPAGGLAQERGRAPDRGPGEDRRLHRRLRQEPGQRRRRSRCSSRTTC